jgi:cystathionine beta-lyase
MIRGINHVTLSVRDLERAFVFYRDVLGLRPLARWKRGAYFLAGDDWLCLSLDDATRDGPLPEYTHLAFDVPRSAFAKTATKVREAATAWKENVSEGESLYVLDPDGHKLELHVGTWRERIRACEAAPYDGMVFFDAPEGMPEEHPFDRVTLAELRERQSAKWRYYPSDVLPAWVAEMDFPVAEPIQRVLHAAVDADDLGYAMAAGLGEAFAPWALARWGWRVAPSDVRLVADVVTGIAEVLRTATEPGEGVVIDTPVYHPFASTILAHGRKVVPAPVTRRGPNGAFVLDLAAIERAYDSGARAHLLCSPHNPTGAVHPRETLAAIAELADRHRVLVISDEIHAPLTAPGIVHTPFPMVSEAAARRGIVLTSASKAWNLAGLKAAMMIACSDEARAVLSRLPFELAFHAGHFGVLAARAAFLEGDPWLASANAAIHRNRALLAHLLAERLPEVGYLPPEAGYLAWLDFSRTDLGDDPARALLVRGKVALSSGPMFGPEGKGFARLNIGTTRSVLEEAVRRVAAALGR